MTTRWGGASQGLDAGQADLHTACELLKAGQYERASEILQQAQLACEERQDAVLAHLLAVACRICLACSQSRAELEWHRQAYETADRREDELRQELQTILDLINEHQALNADEEQQTPPNLSPLETSLQESPLPKTEERSGLWQRFQSLLGWRTGQFRAETDVPETFAKVPTSSAVENVALPAVSLVQQETEGQQRASSLVVYCLGPFRVYQNDQLITEWNSLKSKAIFKYLLARPKVHVTKDILMDVFWPDATPRAARRNLHQAIYSLRQILRGEQLDFQHIQFEDDCYFLNPAMDVWLDFEEFEKHVQAGQRFETAGQLTAAMAAYGVAESIYLDDFLEEDLYEDWPKLQRQHLRNLYLDITDRLTRHYVQQGEHIAAIVLCRKLLAKDTCHEAAHRRLMQCFVAQGQRHLAVRQFQTCAQALKEELNLNPSEETVALHQKITSGQST